MSTQEAILFVVVALLAGAVGGFALAKNFATGRTKDSMQAATDRLAEKDAQSVALKSELETERRAATAERETFGVRLEELHRQLREAGEAHARLAGASESLDALKGQLGAKGLEIHAQAERITQLSADLAHYKADAEAATLAKNEALLAKTMEVERLIRDKDAFLAAQVGDIRAACDRQLADKDEASLSRLRALEASCQAQLAEKDRHVGEQKRLLAEAEVKLSDTFDALSLKALTTMTEQFLKAADAKFETVQAEAKGDLKLKQQAIDDLLRPVTESMAKLQLQHEELETKRVSAFDAIEKSLLTISQETDQLANALRKPATRGAWGEMNLKVILDNAGLTEGVHYDLQDSTEDDEGTRLRTDVILHLPNKRDLVIDSKAPLEAYWDGMNAPDEATKSVKFASHARLVREHVKKLSNKSYWARYKTSPDCVVMFIPTEGAYQAALEADPSLLTDSHSKRIYLANPMTLVNMIQVTAYVLRDETSKQNADEIRATAAELYDRLSKFVSKFADLGRSLRIAFGKYNEAAGSLEGRVLPQGRKVSALGAGSGATLAEVPILEIEPRALVSQEALEQELSIVLD